MGGQVYFEDLDLKYGYSCMPDRLHYFSKEENDFRMEVREWCENNIEPVADKIDRERNTELAVETLRKMKLYLNILIPKEIGGLGKGVLYRVIFGEELTAFNYAIATIFGASSCLFAAPIIEYGHLNKRRNTFRVLLMDQRLEQLELRNLLGVQMLLEG